MKGFKAKGKRISTYQIESIEELEPIREAPLSSPEGDTIDPSTSNSTEAPSGAVLGASENLDPDAGKSQQQIIDEMTGQLRLFDDEV